MNDNNIFYFKDYCSATIDNRKEIIDHYIHNKIDKFFLVWSIKIGYLYLSDNDRSQIPYITAQYREILAEIDDINGFFDKMKRVLK